MADKTKPRTTCAGIGAFVAGSQALCFAHLQLRVDAVT
jgi:hypothetical protein